MPARVTTKLVAKYYSNLASVVQSMVVLNCISFLLFFIGYFYF